LVACGLRFFFALFLLVFPRLGFFFKFPQISGII
jgi:hypothetical protein